MYLDLVSPTMQAIAYCLLLIVLAIYYIKAFRQPQLRSFWLLFALAWTMNLVANIGWIIHFANTQSVLDRLSWIDLFYVTPYILIGITLWTYPKPLQSRVWLWVGTAILVAATIVLGFYFGYVLPVGQRAFANFITYALYPILDAGLIVLAWIRYGEARESHWGKIALLLGCAVTSYGLGNSIEVIGFVFAPVLGGFLQNFFWILRHVFVLLVAISVRKPSDVLEE
jgi:hypothetical protein